VITDDLAALVSNAVFAARDAGEFSLADDNIAVKLETPANKQFGDYSSNIALTLKKATGINNSRDLADRILRHLPQDNSLIDRVEVAGPGFMNFYLKPTWLQDTLVQIEAQDRCFGTANMRAGEKILIEFVSANPTGPISVVNGRAAALGDVLGNLLASQGCTVKREFYINDALNSLQLEKFTETVMARYMQQLGHPLHFAEGDNSAATREAGASQEGSEADLPAVPFPKDGYRGEYVRDIARSIVAESGNRYAGAVAHVLGVPAGSLYHTIITPDEAKTYFRQATLHGMIATQKAALESFGLHFDAWFYESSLYETGTVDKTIATLTERGYTYRQDGALWLRSSALGDDKDRVLVRSNEKATYIAADAAYHDNKFSRGFTRLINIWGADHHGYVGRLKAGVSALGYPPENLEIILTQMVSLVRDGEAVIGGKRQGNVIELKEDLIDDIGKDAARFYFLLNGYETPATVDVELAKRQDKENPVYYVQYAHARLCSILRKAEEQEIALVAAAQADRSQLTQPSELDVLRKLADYPEEVRVASEKYAPHRLTHYAMDMASLLNVFYENCQVLPRSDKPVEPELCLARLALVNGARIVLSNLLGLLGVTAPQEM
jgi:arginyl-tRNA synthetase